MNLAVVKYAKAVITDGSMQIWTGKFVANYELWLILSTIFPRNFDCWKFASLSPIFQSSDHCKILTYATSAIIYDSLGSGKKQTPSRIFHELNKESNSLVKWDPVCRDHVVYATSQWGTMLQCNVDSWLGAFTKWSLRMVEIDTAHSRYLESLSFKEFSKINSYRGMWAEDMTCLSSSSCSWSITGYNGPWYIESHLYWFVA